MVTISIWNPAVLPKNMFRIFYLNVFIPDHGRWSNMLRYRTLFYRVTERLWSTNRHLYITSTNFDELILILYCCAHFSRSFKPFYNFPNYRGLLSRSTMLYDHYIPWSAYGGISLKDITTFLFIKDKLKSLNLSRVKLMNHYIGGCINNRDLRHVCLIIAHQWHSAQFIPVN